MLSIIERDMQKLAKNRLNLVVLSWFGHKRGNIAAFARALDIPSGQASEWLSLEKERFPSSGMIGKIGKVFAVSVTWLLTGTIEKMICDEISELRLRMNVNTVVLADMLGVPLEFLEKIESYKILPSYELLANVRKACSTFGVIARVSAGGEVSANTTENPSDSIQELPFEVGKIVYLLQQDPPAAGLVLSLLEARRTERHLVEKIMSGDVKNLTDEQVETFIDTLSSNETAPDWLRTIGIPIIRENLKNKNGAGDKTSLKMPPPPGSDR
jgi:DNA-binding transcriptional regulator YiaG